MRVYRTKFYKMIKMYLKIQDIFTRPNEFLPDMSGGQTKFREDWHRKYAFIQFRYISSVIRQSFSIPKQSQKSAAVLEDRCRSFGLFRTVKLVL